MIESGSSVLAWVGLGGNLGDPAAALQDALDALDRIFGVELIAVSSVYQSAPVGLSAQPDFLNAVARIDTSLGPGELLEQLLRIETEQGRVRVGERFGPRRTARLFVGAHVEKQSRGHQRSLSSLRLN